MQAPDSTSTEAELEAFRKQWREEVSARNKRPSAAGSSQIQAGEAEKTTATVAKNTYNLHPSTARRKDVFDYSEEVEPRAYHDLPDKEETLKLGSDGQNYDRDALVREPVSALEHYERAVEKETQGHLGDSMRHYRTAFKLDDGVHEAYKRKHFPPSKFVNNPKPSSSSNAAPASHHTQSNQKNDVVLATLKQMLNDFSALRIEPPEPPTDASPPERCAIAQLPQEILSHILLELAIVDVASFARLAQVCKRLAYLVMTEESIWKRVALGAEFGMGAMLYHYNCDINGNALATDDRPFTPGDTNQAPHSSRIHDTSSDPTTDRHLQTTYASSWRQMFRTRPRLRFGGCYISTVNYTRAGANSTNTLTWGAPVHVVTYFRYLRFFRDGGLISLLTTAEPVDVVHHLTRANLLHGKRHAGSLLPSAVMKDALPGRWRLSSAETEAEDKDEGDGDGGEGEVFVETAGVVAKYTYRMTLALAHAGKGARNNKLAWKGFWSYNNLTDDLGTFEMRHARAFYWSRVTSYGIMGE